MFFGLLFAELCYLLMKMFLIYFSSFPSFTLFEFFIHAMIVFWQARYHYWLSCKNRKNTINLITPLHRSKT